MFMLQICVLFYCVGSDCL